MSAVYRHTQSGWASLLVLGAGATVALFIAVATGHPAAIAVFVVLACAYAVFSSLTVEVKGGEVLCAFGVGLVRRRIRLSEVEAVEVVHTPWYYGWGIRLTPHGWLWNVSGTRGIELRYRDGRRFRIGSDEPERLAEAVRRFVSA